MPIVFLVWELVWCIASLAKTGGDGKREGRSDPGRPTSQVAVGASSTLTHEQAAPIAQASGQERPRAGRPSAGRRLFCWGLAGALLFLLSWSASVIERDYRRNPTSNAPGAANEAAGFHPGNAVSHPREPEVQAVATLQVAPQGIDREEYGVVVGRLRVSANVVAKADAMSRADLAVWIRRLDPAILAEVDAINEEIDERREIIDVLNSRAKPLEEKERLSEQEPGRPLSERERTRFEELRTRRAERARRLAELSGYERQQLQRKHEASLQGPGPPLTAAEAAELWEFRAQLEAANGANRRRRAVLLRRLAPLRRRAALLEKKERLSEQAGPPLTEQERGRLDELSEPPGEPLSVSEGLELERLQRKHEASLQVPRPPLTAGEAARLSELRAQRGRAWAAMSAAEQNRDSLLESITGATSVIDANSNTVVFNQRILGVYAGDTLQVRVVDDDYFVDDVLGRFRLDVTAELLEAGEDVLLSDRPDVDSLQLRFRRES